MRLVFAHPLSGLLVRIGKLHDRYLHPMGHCNFRLTSGKIIVASLANFYEPQNIVLVERICIDESGLSRIEDEHEHDNEHD
jgi:hypothetical protein